jgi:hypothetical protein
MLDYSIWKTVRHKKLSKENIESLLRNNQHSMEAQESEVQESEAHSGAHGGEVHDEAHSDAHSN